MKIKLYFLLSFVILSGCQPEKKTQNELNVKIGELAPNLMSLNDGQPLVDIWKNVHNTSTHEIWVDSTNQVTVFIENGLASLVYSTVDGSEFVDLFDQGQQVLTSQRANGNDKLIVYNHKSKDEVWWYVDKNYDGVVDIRFDPNTSGQSEELESQKFIKLKKASNKTRNEMDGSVEPPIR